MGRSRLIALFLAVACANAAAASAQAMYTGLLTVHIGPAQGGDVGDASRTWGGSLAVVDENGVSAELDIAHTDTIDEDFFSDGSVTSFMLNFGMIYPKGQFRPFAHLGAGVLNVRTAYIEDQETTGHTEAGWNAGGGLFVVLNDYLSLRGDVRYFRLFTRPSELALRDSGFFDYWRTTIGATFTWPMR